MGLGVSMKTCSSHCMSISVGASQCRVSPGVQLSVATLHRISDRITELCALGESLKSQDQAGSLISALRQQTQADLEGQAWSTEFWDRDRPYLPSSKVPVTLGLTFER